MAFLLAVVLAVSAGLMAYATESDNAAQMMQTVSQEPEAQDVQPGQTAVQDAVDSQESDGASQNSGAVSEAPGADDVQNSDNTEGVPEEGDVHTPETQPTEESGAAENPGSGQDINEPEGTEIPVTTQEPDGAGATEGADESEEVEGPETSQEPTEPGTEEPGNSQEPSVPGVTENPAGTQEPAAPGTTENPAGTEKPVVPGTTENPAGTENPVVPGTTENPAGTQEPVVPGATGEPVDGQETGLPEGTVPGINGETERVVPENVGQVDVSIGTAQSLNKLTEFSVVLSGAGFEKSDIIQIGDNSTGKSTVHFEELPDGEYSLTVSARGYATYVQSVKVESRAYTINLMTGFQEGVSYEAGKAHAGVLAVGDVAGNDGVINEADKNAMVDAIDQGTGSELTDLNGDGIVNLADLEHFAQTYHDPRDMQAGMEKAIPRSVIAPEAGNGTQVEGDLQALLGNNGSVALKQVWGEDISEEHPVALKFEFNGTQSTNAMDGIIIGNKSDNPVTKMAVNIVYVDEYGNEQPPVEKEFIVEGEGGLSLVLEESAVEAKRDAQGNIRLFLGSQIAVKRVTLIIKGTRQSSNLAEISKVEFVNGMEERIPEPQMDIPKNLVAVAGSQQISLSWDPCVNVTGYEVAIWQDGEGKEVETIMVRGNALDITSYMQDELVNYEKYFIKVQSANGTWRSGYGDTIEAEPQPSGPPDPPDYVNAAGQFRSIIVSWKDMEDTVSYNVYYRAKESGEEFRKIASGIEENRYTISELEDLTAYQIYVTGVNELGESGPSAISLAITTDAKAAVMPKYKLINTGESGQKGAHIISTYRGEGSMVDSPLDTESNTAWGTVDHEPASHYFADTWDEGGFNQMQSRHGLTYEFDETYTIDRFAFHDVTSQYRSYDYVSIRCWDENGELTYSVNQMGLRASSDKDGKAYYMVKLPKAVEAKKIQFGIARNYWASGGINISEVYFYYYDSVFDDIMALYQDDLHLVLKPEVTQKTIDDLRKRINTVDEVSGELHPDYEILKLELENAEKILNAVGLSEPVRIHSTITGANDGGKKFGGLNAWQPIGVTAAAEDKIVVYVGHNTKRTGDATDLTLVATQYNSEASSMFRSVQKLKVGANEITVPKIWTLDYESGGALYVQYGGRNAADQYAVRVSGGVRVPVLDLYQVTDEAARMARTVEYVEKLGTYVSQMEDTHEREHYYSENSLMKKRAFDNQTCILGASDIMLDTMMFSLPAQQIWAGSGKNGTDTESRARTILKSMEAMENMMYLFYQHKGLNANAQNTVDKIPACHQNIRYQRMFAGAFMYASGNHIGIGWGSTSGMVNCGSLVYDEKGIWQSGNYFGWGIAHEIGHCINQGDYAVAEITNNYFAVLAQAKETNDSVRFKYENVYKKVTSNSKGRASNVFTQLGLYWQLHLAFDDGYNFKTYEDHSEQLANLFFARVDMYSRTPSKAPAPGGVLLTLSGDSDQKLMRLSCAAAEKNILSFFERWGMTPDADTISYAAQFPEETRAIYYVNDEARAYRVENKETGSILGTEGKVDVVGDAVTANVVEANKVEINLSSKGIPAADVLGYEIVRCMYEGGVVQEEPVGFATGDTVTYTDVIATINNRTVFYKITLIDKYLNRSAVKELVPVKIEHDGSLDKEFWTVSIKDLTVEGETGTGSTNNLLYCDPENETTYAKDNMIDNKSDTIFTATAGKAPEITLNFNKMLTVAGFKVTGGAGLSGVDYEIMVYGDGTPLSVATGTFESGEVQTIHFANSEDKYISTYEANAVKLILKPAAGSTVSIAELDVLGVTGDNVDFRRTEGSDYVVIGKLKEAFQFGEKPEDVIPAGSIIFAGSYKGNAAYNSVLLFDQDGNNVGDVSGSGDDIVVKADSIILADVPDTGDITDVRNGTWIYWVDAGTDLSGITKVRAELYRVNSALTQAGQRLVSDSLFETVPSVLPEVTLDRADMPK